MKDGRQFVGLGVDEMEKLWELACKEEDLESIVTMGDELLAFYRDIVEKRRELGKRYRDKQKAKSDLLAEYERKFGKLG